MIKTVLHVLVHCTTVVSELPVERYINMFRVAPYLKYMICVIVGKHSIQKQIPHFLAITKPKL